MSNQIRFPFRTLEYSKRDFTNLEKNFVDLIFDGRGFKNPMTADLIDLRNRITTSRNQIATITMTFLGITVPQWEALFDALGELRDTLEDYEQHSDRLTGNNLNEFAGAIQTEMSLADVERLLGSLTDGNFPPSLPGLLGVASAVNSARESVRRDNQAPQDHFSPIFRSILGPAQDAIEETRPVVTTVVGRIQNAPIGQRLSLFNQIGSSVVSLNQRFQDFIESDNNAYYGAIAYLFKYSFATSLLGLGSQTNTFPEYFIRNVSGTPQCKTLLGRIQDEREEDNT